MFATDELQVELTGTQERSRSCRSGSTSISAEATRFRVSVNRGGFVLPEVRRAHFLEIGPYMLASTPGGREELRRVVDPEFADLVDELEPKDLPAVWARPGAVVHGRGYRRGWFDDVVRIDDAHGNLAGFCNLSKPSAGMSQLAAAAQTVDLAHLERMRAVEHADRRPAAILMADLEASSPLARRLSTASYFAFVRRLDTRCGPMCRRCRWHCRPPRRRRHRRLLPRRDRRLGIRRGEIVHHRRASPARHAHRDRRARARSPHPSCHFGSGSTGVRRCTSGESSPPVAAKSPPSATKSTRPRGSKPARPAAGHSPPNRSSNDSTGPTPTRSASTRAASPTPTRRPRHRNRQGTPRRPRHRRLRDLNATDP